MRETAQTGLAFVPRRGCWLCMVNCLPAHHQPATGLRSKARELYSVRNLAHSTDEPANQLVSYELHNEPDGSNWYYV